jgi:ABC-type uncharacterized transport system permease subunit
MEAQAGVSSQLAVLMQGLVVLFVTVANVGSQHSWRRRARTPEQLLPSPIPEVVA